MLVLVEKKLSCDLRKTMSDMTRISPMNMHSNLGEKTGVLDSGGVKGVNMLVALLWVIYHQNLHD